MLFLILYRLFRQFLTRVLGHNYETEHRKNIKK